MLLNIIYTNISFKSVVWTNIKAVLRVNSWPIASKTNAESRSNRVFERIAYPEFGLVSLCGVCHSCLCLGIRHKGISCDG